MTVTVKLTGLTRYRVHRPLFGKQILILQVEKHYEGYAPDGWGFGESVNCYRWSDATPEDITTKDTL